MLIGETVTVAFQSIRANTLRSLLTMLGIIIGVGAVITTVALGSGASKAIDEKIAALGANIFTVMPGQAFHGGVASSNRASLTTDDYDAIRRDATLISAVVPEMRGSFQLKFGAQNVNTTVYGTTANFVHVKNYTVPFGQSFTDGDDVARQRYAVLGAAVPEMLGANPAAMIHQTLLVRGIPFEIIGVLSAKGAQGFQNPDENVYVPLQTAKYRVIGRDALADIGIQVRQGVPIEQGMVDLERILRRQHRIRPGGDNDFQIRNPQDLLATQQQTSQLLGVLLACVAAVSLLVGGIGIMNIMLVSVTERTKEIGVRKALGATRFDIMSQFLVEALVLCISGGAIGIMMGIGTAVVLSHFAQWNVLISPASVVVAFGFSAAVGLFFGIWPARRAAALDPIVALRYE